MFNRINKEDVMILAYRNCKSKNEQIEIKRDILCQLEYDRLYRNDPIDLNLKLIKERTAPRNEKEKKLKQETVKNYLIDKCLNSKSIDNKMKVDIINTIITFGDYEYYPPITGLSTKIFKEYFENKNTNLNLVYLFPFDTTMINLFDIENEMSMLLKKNMIMPSPLDIEQFILLCIFKAIWDLKIVKTIIGITNEKCESFINLYSFNLKYFPISINKKDVLLKLAVIQLRKEDKTDALTLLFSGNEDAISNKLVKIILERAVEYVDFYFDAAKDTDELGPKRLYITDDDLERAFVNFSIGILTGLKFKLDTETEFRIKFEENRSLKRNQDVNPQDLDYTLPLISRQRKIYNLPLKILPPPPSPKEEVKPRIETDPLYLFIYRKLESIWDNELENETINDLLKLVYTLKDFYNYKEYREMLMDEISKYDYWVEEDGIQSATFDLMTSFLDRANSLRPPPSSSPSILLLPRLPRMLQQYDYDVILEKMDDVYKEIEKINKSDDVSYDGEIKRQMESALKDIFDDKVYEYVGLKQEEYDKMLVIAEIYSELLPKDQFPSYIVPFVKIK